jgi:hypothetical protein
MLDTTHITTAITRLIVTGVPEGELLARVARLFPELTPAELSAALREGRAAGLAEALRTLYGHQVCRRRDPRCAPAAHRA